MASRMFPCVWSGSMGSPVGSGIVSTACFYPIGAEQPMSLSSFYYNLYRFIVPKKVKMK